MASNFPTSVDATPNVADGTDYIEATDINTPKDSAEAVQTMVGASGASQAHNTDILTQLYEVNPTIKLSYTSATTVTASVGVVVCKNAAGSIKKLRKNTSTTAITFADIDTGAEASSTTYYVWASADATATTVAFKISTNATTPSGLTTYRLIGGFYNNSGSDVEEKSVWSAGGMRVVNFAYYQTGAVATGTTAMPTDDTIPQITEGDQYMSLVVAPKSATNKLKIDVVAFLSHGSGTTGRVNGALFQDSTANALAAGFVAADGAANGSLCLKFTHYMVAGTILGTTFRFRAGGDGSTVTFNGSAAARQLGGVLASSLSVTEYEV